MEIKGVGEILSNRIINYLNEIGGFVDDLQLKEVYGLKFEVRFAIEEKFSVKTTPEIAVLNVNTASVLEFAEGP